MPKVSFILPAYKRRFLQKAISSILDQTYKDFELIVVDDDSPENLKEIIDNFNDDRLIYHKNSCNIGGKDLVAAWNKALSYASGEFVVCAGDDDKYESDYLKEMVLLSEKYPQVDVFHCRIAFIDGEGHILRIGNPRAEFESGIQMAYHSSVRRLGQVMADFMYKKTALDKIGGYVYSPSAWFTDIMTSIQLSLKNGAVCSSRTLLQWRTSGVNISDRFDDVDVKIQASLDFETWMEDILREIKPQDDDDRLVLSFLRKELKPAILASIHYYWEKVPYAKAITLLNESNLSADIKKQWRMEKFKGRYGVVANYIRIKEFLRRVLHI